MRPESMFYFFKSADQGAEKNAVTTLVTYKRGKKVVPLFAGDIRRQYRKAVQRMYANVIRKGTLHANGSVTTL
jgi:hypothetical protein